jgi:hypothetical protein
LHENEKLFVTLTETYLGFMQKYSVNQQLIETVLASVRAGEIAISEIQHPFVWNSSKVRDLMDSLYQGYPSGYLIAWRNPNVRLKFSRNYLKKNGLDRSQIAYYVYKQSEINIKIGNRPPKEYFGLITNQIQNANPIIRGISIEMELLENLGMNCVPEEIMGMEMRDYQEFLGMRRMLMAEKIKEYYEEL